MPRAAILLLALPLAAAAPASASDDSLERPPTSLAPERGKLEFEHMNRRATECYFHETSSKKNTKRCRAKRENAPGGTSVTLTPVDRTGVAATDARKPVNVTLPDEASPVRQTIEIEVGDWEVSWGDERPPKRVRVASGQQSSVDLRTLSGRCVRAADTRSCTLKAERRTRRVTVEPGREVR